VSERVRVELSQEINWESTWANIGLTLNLHSQDPWTPHSRINLLHALNVDVEQIIDRRNYDSTPLMEFWDFQCEEEENLEVVEVNIESVHGMLTRCHFTHLIRAVRRNHPTLLETVTAILGQRYGIYSQWRFAARQHASAATIEPVDWGALGGGSHQSNE
jgi:hypothetical protein